MVAQPLREGRAKLKHLKLGFIHFNSSELYFPEVIKRLVSYFYHAAVQLTRNSASRVCWWDGVKAFGVQFADER